MRFHWAITASNQNHSPFSSQNTCLPFLIMDAVIRDAMQRRGGQEAFQINKELRWDSFSKTRALWTVLEKSFRQCILSYTKSLNTMSYQTLFSPSNGLSPNMPSSGLILFFFLFQCVALNTFMHTRYYYLLKICNYDCYIVPLDLFLVGKMQC